MTRPKAFSRAPRVLAVAFAVIAAAASLAAYRVEAKQKNKKNLPPTGRIEVSTQPGGYPITIDGQAAGETTDYPRAIELPPGPHNVEILFPNNTRWSQVLNILENRKNCIQLNYRPRPVTVPDVSVLPCPYSVNVTASPQVEDGAIVTFTADAHYQGPSKLNYTWTVSPPSAGPPGGSDSPTITVDSSGLANKRVTAIVVVDDGSGDRSCRQMAQASTIVVPTATPTPPPVFDEFPSVAHDDDKARFDNLVIKFQDDPTATGYIIAYGGRDSQPGEADRMGQRAVDYLLTKRGITRDRVKYINGGYREENTYELWVMPPGAAPPRPRPTVSPDQVRPGPPRRYKRRF